MRKGFFTLVSFILILLLLGCNKSNEESFELKVGDLLFAVGTEGSDFTSAIQNSTSDYQEVPYSHVGIVSIENNEVMVIEATPKGGVVISKLDDFFSNAASVNNDRYIAVGRLTPDLQYTITDAIISAKQNLGKEYDFLYDESNDSFYCSELVRFSFIDSMGNYIFKPLSMSFKNKETGQAEPFWISHFNNYGLPVPEGEPGSNPTDMAKSSQLEIVHSYF